MSDNLHTEAPRSPRHFKPNAPQSQHPELLAAQLDSLQGLLLPLPGVHRRVRFRKLPRQARASCPGSSSATAMAFAPGVFITTMPRRVAASASILSTPTPARPITRSFGADASRASSTCTADRTTRPSASVISDARPFLIWSWVTICQSWFSLKHGESSRRNLLRQNDFHSYSLEI